MKNLSIKRVYLPAEQTDGYRIFTDFLWPRGLTKEKVKFDLWLKEIAPSTALRKWFNHDPEKWLVFKKHYFEELSQKQACIQAIIDQLQTQTVTLLYGAKDEKHNHALALKEFIEKHYFYTKD